MILVYKMPLFVDLCFFFYSVLKVMFSFKISFSSHKNTYIWIHGNLSSFLHDLHNFVK